MSIIEEGAVLQEESLRNEIMDLETAQELFASVVNEPDLGGLEELMIGVYRLLKSSRQHQTDDDEEQKNVQAEASILYVFLQILHQFEILPPIPPPGELLRDLFLPPRAWEKLKEWNYKNASQLFSLLQHEESSSYRFVHHRRAKKHKGHSGTAGYTLLQQHVQQSSSWQVSWIALVTNLVCVTMANRVQKEQEDGTIEWTNIETTVRQLLLPGSSAAAVVCGTQVTAGLTLAALDILDSAKCAPPTVPGNDNVVIVGLTPRKVASMLKVPSVVDYYLVHATWHAVPRMNLLAHFALVLLDYGSNYLASDDDDNEDAFDTCRICDSIVRSAFQNDVCFLLGQLSAVQQRAAPMTRGGAAATTTSPAASSTATKKRKRLEDETHRRIPSRMALVLGPSYPFIVRIQVDLANNNRNDARNVASCMETCTALSPDEKTTAWSMVMDHLRYNGDLFLDGNNTASSSYQAKRTMLLELRRFMGVLGVDTMIDFYKQLEQAVSTDACVTRDESRYVTKACQDTVLKLCVDKWGELPGVQRMLEEFPSLYVWGDGDVKKWAIRFATQANPIPETLLLNGQLDLNSLWNRVSPEEATGEEEVSIETVDKEVVQVESAEETPTREEVVVEHEVRDEEVVPEQEVQREELYSSADEEQHAGEVHDLEDDSDVEAGRPSGSEVVLEILSADEDETEESVAEREIDDSEGTEGFEQPSRYGASRGDDEETADEDEVVTTFESLRRETGATAPRLGSVQEAIDDSEEEEDEEKEVGDEEASAHVQYTYEQFAGGVYGSYDEYSYDEEKEDDDDIGHADEREVIEVGASEDEEMPDTEEFAQGPSFDKEDVDGDQFQEPTDGHAMPEEDGVETGMETQPVEQEVNHEEAVSDQQYAPDTSDQPDADALTSRTPGDGQVDQGYEPDTTGQTEEEISEAQPTEDEEENADKKKRSVSSRLAPTLVRGHIASRHTFSDMDAADERTEAVEEDESSEVEGRAVKDFMSSTARTTESKDSSALAALAHPVQRSTPSRVSQRQSDGKPPFHSPSPLAQHQPQSLPKQVDEKEALAHDADNVGGVHIVDQVPKIEDVHAGDDATNETVGPSEAASDSRTEGTAQAERLQEEMEQVVDIVDSALDGDAQYLVEANTVHVWLPEASVDRRESGESPGKVMASEKKPAGTSNGNITDVPEGYMGDSEEKPPSTSNAPATTAAISMQPPGYEADVEEKVVSRDDESLARKSPSATRTLPTGVPEVALTAVDASANVLPTYDNERSAETALEQDATSTAASQVKFVVAAAASMGSEEPEGAAGDSVPDSPALPVSLRESGRAIPEVDVTEEQAMEVADSKGTPSTPPRRARRRSVPVLGSPASHTRSHGSPASHTRSHDLGSPARHTRSHDAKRRRTASSSPRKGRGRPRKHLKQDQVDQESLSTHSRANSRLSTSPRSRKSSSPKRQPGRPKKHPKEDIVEQKETPSARSTATSTGTRRSARLSNRRMQSSTEVVASHSAKSRLSKHEEESDDGEEGSISPPKKPPIIRRSTRASRKKADEAKESSSKKPPAGVRRSSRIRSKQSDVDDESGSEEVDSRASTRKSKTARGGRRKKQSGANDRDSFGSTREGHSIAIPVAGDEESVSSMESLSAASRRPRTRAAARDSLSTIAEQSTGAESHNTSRNTRASRAKKTAKSKGRSAKGSASTASAASSRTSSYNLRKRN